MACSTCSTTNMGDSSNVWMGSLIGGARKEIPFARKALTVSALRTPNIVLLDENPYMVVGDKFLLNGIGSIGGAFTGVVECATVTAAPVLVAGKWEIGTDLAMVSLTGSPTLETAAAAAAGGLTGFGCDTTTTGAKSTGLQAIICSGTLNAANFAGYVYTRRPGADSTGFDAYIVAGSNQIQVSKRSGIRKGDRITLSGTGITEANPATVTAIASGNSKTDNQPIILATLSIPVTAVTATAGTDGRICVSAIASPQAIANLTFTVECGCKVVATLPAAITNLSTFPAGTPYADSDCGQTQYCYAIHDFTPGAVTRDYTGILVL